MSERSSQPEAAGFRWWEYYAVRYAMGVGVGTPLVCLLWHHYHPFFALAVRIPTPFNSALSAILWASAGLTFCYISSVHMLTIHTARAFLNAKCWSRTLIIVLVSLLTVPSIAISFFAQVIDCVQLTQRVALIVLWLLFSFQFFLIVTVLANPNGTEQLYDSLTQRRPYASDFVESYRHMREHGNSVLIVIGEFLLTYCLWEIHPGANPSPAESKVLLYLLSILAVWLTPSGLVWFVGTRLERHLTEKPPNHD